VAGSVNATGVKIRIRNTATNSDVYYGPKSSTPGNPGQFLAGSMSDASAGNVITLPFTASYVRPDSTPVTGGKVKAVATFTMSYQ